MAKFQGIPVVPNSGIEQWQVDFLNAIKEDLEIMMGVRGPGRAVTNDTITVEPQAWQQMTQLSARGEFTTNAAVGVPTITDYIRLLNDMQQLTQDVATIQRALVALLQQMKA